MTKFNLVDRRTGKTTTIYADSVEEVFSGIASGEIGKKGTKKSSPTYAVNHFVLVTDLVDWYIDHCKTWSPDDRDKFRAHFHKYFDGIEVMSVDQSVIDDYIAVYCTEEGKALQTAKRRLTVLRAAMNFAIARKRMPSQPEISWVLKVAEPRRERVFTRSECARLLWAARKHRMAKVHAKRRRITRNPLSWFEAYLWIALYTGARPEAIARLKFSQIDFIDWQIDFRNDKASRKKRSVVPVANALKPILMRLRRERPDNVYVLNTMRAVTPGRPAIASAFTETMGMAGISIGEGLNRASAYTLRHTTASLILRRGASVWAAAGVLGVSTQRIEKTYGKHMVDHLRETVNKL